MKKVEFITKTDLSPFINCIMVDECTDLSQDTKIPIYADGYPGIMFHKSTHEFFRQPRTKKLSELFLYGQTLDSITLETKGVFSCVVVQLYPFASKYLLNIDPKVLNDECFDLLQLNHIPVHSFYQRLTTAETLEDTVIIISELMRELIVANKVPQNDIIQQSIKRIIEQRGQVKIQDIQAELNISERTFERNFVSETGLTPKQFAKIIQFQYSVDTLNSANFNTLTDVGVGGGFSDQSHFTRVFKEYTGITPSLYLQTAHVV